jgi:hypothetical protein
MPKRTLSPVEFGRLEPASLVFTDNDTVTRPTNAKACVCIFKTEKTAQRAGRRFAETNSVFLFVADNERDMQR